MLKGFRDFTGSAPDEVTSVIVTITFPANPEMPPETHDRAIAIVGAVYAGDVDEGMKITEPLRQLGTPIFDMSGPTPFIGVQTGFDALFPRNTIRAYWKSQYVDELTDEAIAFIAKRAQERPAPMTLLNTFHMGGAINAVDPEDTAFSARTSPYMISIDGMWTEADGITDEQGIEWARSVFAGVSEFGTGEVYLNFSGLAGDEAQNAGVDSALGRNMKRLGEIKAKYDPDNFFRVNNNIAPAS